jgi:hypothetical protein
VATGYAMFFGGLLMLGARLGDRMRSPGRGYLREGSCMHVYGHAS